MPNYMDLYVGILGVSLILLATHVMVSTTSGCVETDFSWKCLQGICEIEVWIVISGGYRSNEAEVMVIVPIKKKKLWSLSQVMFMRAIKKAV